MLVNPKTRKLSSGEPHAPHGARKNQRQQILDKLIAAGTWVPAPELAAVSLQYSARIRELRLDGCAIENRVKIVRGQKLGEFRLKSWSAAENGALVVTPATTSAPRTSDSEGKTPMLLFPEGLAPVHRDDG
jgi:hypothetical protein